MPEATERRVPSGTSYAAEVPEGSLLTLTDLEESRSSTWSCSAQADPGEQLSIADAAD